MSAGRRTKFTPSRTRAIAVDLREGLSLAAAAKRNGIAASTLFCWLRKGRDGVGEYSECSDALTRARAELQRDALRYVRRAEHPTGRPDWRSLAWLLERLFPPMLRGGDIVRAQAERDLAKVLDVFEEVIDARACATDPRSAEAAE